MAVVTAAAAAAAAAVAARGCLDGLYHHSNFYCWIGGVGSQKERNRGNGMRNDAKKQKVGGGQCGATNKSIYDSRLLPMEKSDQDASLAHVAPG
jgi:hypothetical protein